MQVAAYGAGMKSESASLMQRLFGDDVRDEATA